MEKILLHIFKMLKSFKVIYLHLIWRTTSSTSNIYLQTHLGIMQVNNLSGNWLQTDNVMMIEELQHHLGNQSVVYYTCTKK